ncbi:glycogen debranching N-terminal domain-containing protein [Streptomyces sp. NPDC050418]|uniref:glycogen debranching N-terminal domain-containing protein n=1 Tax=Streptomyces sp. NPDC050418 TaxID=3365612 RepID=UPI00379DC3DB
MPPPSSSTTRADPATAAPLRSRPAPRPTGGEGGPGVRPPSQLPPVHASLICVALPGLAISAEHGQLTGHGLEGIYRAGRRLLSRCRLRIAGREPLALQGRLLSADRARFVGVVRHVDPSSPDPVVTVERTRSAEGTERITLHSSATRPLRLPVEVTLATDLAELGAVASGAAGPELPASVYGSGLRWSSGTARPAVVSAHPAPQDALASAGLLRWEVDLPAGGSHTIDLTVRQDGTGQSRPAGHGAHAPLSPARAEGDHPGVPQFMATCIDDLQALLLRDPAHPSDLHPAAGAPWRCGLAPAEALATARMTLPLGTRLAAGTLRTLARTQLGGDGPDAGLIPGPLRDAGPHLPPSSTGVEATLLFPVLLAEARRWGLPEPETRELLPVAERCLRWLRTAGGGGVYLPEPGPGGLLRCETQAHAHRAALLGADLLDMHGRSGGDQWRNWAGELREAFRRDFWIDDVGGGRPAAARTADGRLVPHLGGAAAHLLDTGLLGGGSLAPGLLGPVRTEQLARLLGGPALDSGWGLRSLGAKEAGYNPFGHRGGAVRGHETAVAVAGLAAAGYEKEASALLEGVLAAAEHFGGRLPEMYAGDQRAAGCAPLPHPAACRPAAVSAAAGLHLILAQAGIRPDAAASTVSLAPMTSAPLGELSLTGLHLAGSPFAVRISRLGLAMVEEAGEGLQLGVRTTVG